MAQDGGVTSRSAGDPSCSSGRRPHSTTSRIRSRCPWSRRTSASSGPCRPAPFPTARVRPVNRPGSRYRTEPASSGETASWRLLRGIPVSLCQRNLPPAARRQTAGGRSSEAGGEPFAAGVGRRRQAVPVDPDDVGVAHDIVEGADGDEAVTPAAQPVEDVDREPVLDGDGEVPGVDDPPGGGEGHGGIGTVVDEAGEELDLRLEL